MSAPADPEKGALVGEISLAEKKEIAQKAAKSGDVDASKAAHGAKINMEEHSGQNSDYIKSLVFGGLDGIITTFAVVAAVISSSHPLLQPLLQPPAHCRAPRTFEAFGESADICLPHLHQKNPLPPQPLPRARPSHRPPHTHLLHPPVISSQPWSIPSPRNPVSVPQVAGAEMENNVVILMGIANLVSDGISMGLGDYLSAKSEQSYIKSEFEREKWEMEQNPQGEAGTPLSITIDTPAKGRGGCSRMTVSPTARGDRRDDPALHTEREGVWRVLFGTARHDQGGRDHHHHYLC